MNILANRYGHTRPAEIAARVAALCALCPAAPVLVLVPTASTSAPVAKIGRSQIAQWQAERAQLRADLPMLRAAAIDAMYHGHGPDFAEIRDVEDRLATLDDYLVFEPEFPAAPLALAA